MRSSPEKADLPHYDTEAEVRTIMADIEIDKIVFSERGGQLREPANGARMIETFIYPSKRYRRSFSGEGRVEEKVTLQAEVLSNYVNYLPQLCRIEAKYKGKSVSAIPDFGRVMIGSIPELGEAKYDFAGFNTPRALLQQAITRCGAMAMGWGYTQCTHSNLGTPAFIKAVNDIQMCRFLHVTLREEQVMSKILRKHSSVALGDLADELSNCTVRGRHLVYAMMVRRKLAIDLQSPLSSASMVRLPPTLPLSHYPLWQQPQAQ